MVTKIKEKQPTRLFEGTEGVVCVEGVTTCLLYGSDDKLTRKLVVPGASRGKCGDGSVRCFVASGNHRACGERRRHAGWHRTQYKEGLRRSAHTHTQRENRYVRSNNVSLFLLTLLAIFSVITSLHFPY